MSPRENRNRRDRKSRPDDEEVEAKPQAKKRPWRLYAIWGIPALVSSMAAAGFGAWFALQSIPPPVKVLEEPADEVVDLDVEGMWLVPGLDLARERPLGRDTGIMPMNVNVAFPGRATNDYVNSNLEPRRVEDLNRPLIARVPASATIERSARDVTAGLSEAGGLGGAEPLRMRRPEPRAPGEPEPAATGPQDWVPRTISDDALTASTVSTMPSPGAYTTGADEEPLDTPQPMIAEPHTPRLVAPRDRGPIAAPSSAAIPALRDDGAAPEPIAEPNRNSVDLP